MHPGVKKWIKAGIQALAVCAVLYAILMGVCYVQVRPVLHRTMCLKNLVQFGFHLRLYAGDHGEETFRNTGFLIQDTNFFQKAYLLRWRFSRDGINPACPASLRDEINSYEGIQSPTLILTNSSPIAWEKYPYHQGRRHVLFFDGHVALVSEPEFQATSNSLATFRTGIEIRLVDEAAFTPGTTEAVTNTLDAVHLDKKVLLAQSELSAVRTYRGKAGDARIILVFTRPGSSVIESITRENVGRRLAVLLNGKVISVVPIRSAITSGEIGIFGNWKEAEAEALAREINKLIKSGR